MRASAGSASRPQTTVGIPPATSDQRAPASWAIKPTSGPPIGVEPCHAIPHSAITRPRISGRAAQASGQRHWRLSVPGSARVQRGISSPSRA